MEETEVKKIADIALETIDALDNVYCGEYEEDKRYLVNLTRMAVTLAANEKSDAENIRSLGEGWTGEEAWDCKAEVMPFRQCTAAFKTSNPM